MVDAIEANLLKASAKNDNIYKFIKRSFDIVLSGCVLLVLSWLLVIVAIVVKLTSKGSIFFLDRRVGINGKEICIFKFRTMYVDAEERIHDYLDDDQYMDWLKERKVENDPRITTVGKILRKTSVDELPQLINILKGDMSIVGPRPLTKSEVEKNFNMVERKKLLSCKPGLAGNWAAHGRSTVTYENGERQRMELEYVDKQSLSFDIKLICATFISVLNGKGAQ